MTTYIIPGFIDLNFATASSQLYYTDLRIAVPDEVTDIVFTGGGQDGDFSVPIVTYKAGDKSYTAAFSLDFFFAAVDLAALGPEVQITMVDGGFQAGHLLLDLHLPASLNPQGHSVDAFFPLSGPSLPLLTDDDRLQLAAFLPNTDKSDGYAPVTSGNRTLSVTLADIPGVGISEHDFGRGTDDGDRMHLGLGNDTCVAGAGRDKIFGGAGSDTLHGQMGADRLVGGQGQDVLFGGRGQDLLRGDRGNDSLDGGDNQDVLLGGKGADNLYFSAGSDSVKGQGGKDSFIFRDDIFAGATTKARVVDFQDDIDQILFVRGIEMNAWEQANQIALGAHYIANNFFSQKGDNVVMKFGDATKVIFTGVSSIDQLLDDIVII